MNETTPEPGETERWTELMTQLEDTQSYDSRTLTMNDYPDGLVLRDWIHRRRATLEGKLTPTTLPANENPGTIADTLAWERRTHKLEAKLTPGYMLYLRNLKRPLMTDYDRQWGPCPITAEKENRWFAQRKEEHARGMHPEVFDWGARADTFKQQCNQEDQARHSAKTEETQSWSQAMAQKAAELEKCSKPYDLAQKTYQAEMNWTNGDAATAAGVGYDRCTSIVEKKYSGHIAPDVTHTF